MGDPRNDIVTLSSVLWQSVPENAGEFLEKEQVGDGSGESLVNAESQERTGESEIRTLGRASLSGLFGVPGPE